MAYTTHMARLRYRYHLLSFAFISVTLSGALAQPKASPQRRVQLAIHLDGAGRALGGEGYGAATDVRDEQTVAPGPNGEVGFVGLPHDLDLGTVELETVDGKPAPAIAEQRYWPADESPEGHLVRNLGATVTVTTTRGEVVGLLRAVDGDSIALEVGKELRVLRRGAFVQDIRFATSQWRATSMLTWRFTDGKLQAPRMLGIHYQTQQISEISNLAATLDEVHRTIDVTALATLHNGTGVDFGPAQLTLFTDGNRDTATPLPTAIALPSNADVTVALLPPLRKAPVTTLAIAESSVPMAALDAEHECGWSQPTSDGTTTQGYEFAVAPEVALPRSTVRMTASDNRIDYDDEMEVTLEIGKGRGLLLRGTAPISVEHQQVDCKVDEKANTLRETITVTISNSSNAAMMVELREPMMRSKRWKVESSNVPVSARTEQDVRYRVSVPANGDKQLTYTMGYSW